MDCLKPGWPSFSPMSTWERLQADFDTLTHTCPICTEKTFEKGSSIWQLSPFAPTWWSISLERRHDERLMHACFPLGGSIVLSRECY